MDVAGIEPGPPDQAATLLSVAPCLSNDERVRIFLFVAVSLFAELFSEMLLRDAGFRIYKAIVTQVMTHVLGLYPARYSFSLLKAFGSFI